MIKTYSCISLHCDSCGDSMGDDYTEHFNSQAEAEEQAVDAYEWRVTRDGQVFCRACEYKAPTCTCPDVDACGENDCVPGCPCVLHPAIPADELVPALPLSALSAICAEPREVSA